MGSGSSSSLAAATAALVLAVSAGNVLAGAAANQVLSYTSGAIADPSYTSYVNANATLGLPMTTDAWGTDVTPFTPAWSNSDLAIVGPGGSLALHLDAPVSTTGRTLGVFSSIGLIAAFDPGTGIVTAAPGPQLFSTTPTMAVVSVAQLPGQWIPLNSGNPIDLAMPANAFSDSTLTYDPEWAWLNVFGGTTANNPFQPFTGGLADFGGKTYAQMLALLGTSAGGAWIDTSAASAAGLSAINFIKFEVPTGANYRLVLDAVTGIATPPLNATWTASGDTHWSDAANWTGGVPAGAGATANLGGSTPAGINLDYACTVGRVLISGSANYTIDALGGNALTLDNTGGIGHAAITVTGTASHTVNAPIVTAGLTDISVVPTASLNLAGGIRGFGSTIVSAGTVSAASIVQSSLTVDGVAKITPTGTPNTATSVLSASLTIAGSTGAWTGQLDLGNNSLVIQGAGSATRNTVADQIRQGLAGDGNGITSSAALTNASGDTTLGYALASDLQPAGTFNFSGQTVGGDDVLVKYTWKADANLDGIVNVADLGILATNYGLAGQNWVSADFNSDGQVNVADLGLLATYYGRGTSPGTPLLSFADALASFPQLGGTASVPEPASLSLLGLGAMILLRRRTRRS